MQLDDLSLGPINGKFADDPMVDGFTLDMNTILNPTQYRANAQIQMEVLRRSVRYQWKVYTAPTGENLPVVARGQIETRISMAPGTYIYGISVSRAGGSIGLVFVGIWDACNELQLFADYVQGLSLSPQTGSPPYAPMLFEPKVIASPGQVVVEVYNSTGENANLQVALFCAEPCPANPDWANPRFLGRGPQEED